MYTNEDGAKLSSSPTSTQSASQLQQSQSEGDAVAVSFDVAALGLYKDYLPPTILAILAEMGPSSGQQKHGNLVTLLFPVVLFLKNLVRSNVATCLKI